jgi:hypothetical protein
MVLFCNYFASHYMIYSLNPELDSTLGVDKLSFNGQKPLSPERSGFSQKPVSRSRAGSIDISVGDP